MQRRSLLAILAAMVAAGAMLPAQQASANSARPRRPDVIYVPTSNPVVARMLEVAHIRPADVVYDLGCGDGRIPIMAAQRYGARGVGIDINPERIREARQNARNARVEDRVSFIEGDLFQADIAEATVVTLYLGAALNMKLRPKLLAELRPGTRVVSHDFDMGDWKPEWSELERGANVYLWRIPLRKQGTVRDWGFGAAG